MVLVTAAGTRTMSADREGLDRPDQPVGHRPGRPFPGGVSPGLGTSRSDGPPADQKRRATPAASAVTPSDRGIGRSSSPTAARVSEDLRTGTGVFLSRRRRVAALSLLASAAMGVLAAYQNGLIRHLPEPPLPLLDADRVDASAEAYEPLKTPDAALGLASYALTLALAGAGTASRAEQRPWLPLTMAAKVAADALGGLYLTAEQASKHRRFCAWCLAATATSVAMVPQVLPEARAALVQLSSRARQAPAPMA